MFLVKSSNLRKLDIMGHDQQAYERKFQSFWYGVIWVACVVCFLRLPESQAY